MSVLEYIFRRGRTEVIKHSVVSTPEIVFPDTLSNADIKLFIDTKDSCFILYDYIQSSYSDPYHVLNTSYSRLGNTLYMKDSYKDIESGYIEYTVDLREVNRKYMPFDYGRYTSNSYYESKYLYAIVKDGLLLCVIDGHIIKTSVGDEYSLYKFDSIPNGLRDILIKVITNHNVKILAERSRLSSVNNEYAEKVKNQKDRIQSMLNGIN